MLWVHYFGVFEITDPSRNLSLPPSVSARSLLAYLLLYNDRPHARAKLSGIFWPEMPELQARGALRRALWDVRHAVGEDIILANRDQVWSAENAPLWLDVTEFENALSRGRMEDLYTALKLYRGRFLEGMYQDWTLLESDRLHEAYLNTLERLITLTKSAGDYETALEHARTLVAEDPLRESAHREIMRLFHALGRPEAAIQQFEACRNILQRELGFEPEAETIALLKEIARSGGIASPVELLTGRPRLIPYALDATKQMPFIGREAERSILLERMQSAFAGQGGLMLIGGEAGVGKTRLLQALAHEADWHGATVLWGHATEHKIGPSYHALLDALTPLFTPRFIQQLTRQMDALWLKVAAPLFPVLAESLPDSAALPPLEGEHAKTRLFEAFTQIILAASRLKPLLILLEDLHWSDGATLEALAYLTPRLAAGRVLLAASFRLGEAEANTEFHTWLEKLTQAVEDLTILTLDRLTLEETDLLIRRGLGLPESAPLFTARLHKETGGNPLFLLETLRSLHESGVLARDEQGNWVTPHDAAVDYSELPLSPEVKRVIQQRLDRLTPEARQALSQAAILGDNFSFPILRRASLLEQNATLRALNELLRHRLLEKAGTDYRFSHTTVRSVVYASISPDERKTLHRKAAQVLETIPQQPASVLAYHCEQGGLLAKAAKFYLRAGKEAAALYAIHPALTYFARASELESHLAPEERFDLYASYESILHFAGDQQTRAHILERMSRLAETARNEEWGLKVTLCKAHYLAQIGEYDQAEAQVHKALDTARSRADCRAEAAALLLLGSIANWRGMAEAAVASLQQAATLYQQCEDLAGEAEAHNALANALLGIKAYREAREHSEIALNLCENLADRPGQADAANILGIIAMEQGDMEAAVAYYRRELEIARSVGYRYSEARSLGNWGNIDFFNGQIDQALRRYRQAMEIFSDIDSTRIAAMLRINLGAILASTVGDLEAGETMVQQALTYFRKSENLLGMGQCLAVLGQIAFSRNETEAARAYLEEGIDCLQTAGEAWIEVQARMALAQVLVEAGEARLALHTIEVAERLCRQHQMKDFLTRVLSCKGYILLALGQRQQALELSSQALASLSESVPDDHLVYFYHFHIARACGQMEPAVAALEQAARRVQKMLAGLTPEQQETSRTRVRDHREILAAWAAWQPRRERVRLPRADAPTGRPLRPEEYIEITWTLSTPEDQAISPKSERRRARLLRLMQEAAAQGAAPTQEHLAEALGVGVRTIARDMAALRAAGHSLPQRR